MKKHFVILGTIAACGLLYFIEQGLAANYLVKTLSKVLLFVGVPSLYKRLFQEDSIEAKPFRRLSFRSLWPGVVIGLGAMLIIFVTYHLTLGLVDYDGIIAELENKSGITATNFLLVGLYITLSNSFLEEFFFRGFVFFNLFELGGTWAAYGFSALAFALYHLAIFRTWFDGPLMALALLGLVGIAVILNWLTAKSDGFLSAWIAHALANIAIILIGLRLFANK